ncbi:MAG: acylglycerol kinase family protein [Pseudomonadota bacterium]
MSVIAILTNPTSTSNKRNLERIRAFTKKVDRIVHVEIGDISEVEQALELIERAGPPDALLINGGDGTVQAVLSVIFNRHPFPKGVPPLAVLPAGKTNMIAADLGAPKNHLKVAQKLVDLIRSDAFSESLVQRNLLAVRFREEQKEAIYAMFAGAASIVSAIHYTRRTVYALPLPKGISHIFVFVRLCIDVLMGARSETGPARVEEMKINLRGGGVFKGRFLLILITTLDQALLRFKTNFSGRKAGLRFLAVEGRAGAFFRAVFGIISGRLGKAFVPGSHIRQVDKMRISLEGEITLDGELYTPVAGQDVLIDATQTCTFISL